uniref:TetR family transcriptional regulator C-terminal domain-containing protein n=1 Tax=Streptomyces otsuchiensis TaxID=2681388 RepID=UPI003F689D27
PPGPTRVLTVYTAAERWAERNPRGCAFVNAWAELGTTSPPVAEAIREEKQWMRELFSRLTTPEIAGHLHLLYEGAHVAATTLEDDTAYAGAREAARCLLRTTGGE